MTPLPSSLQHLRAVFGGRLLTQEEDIAPYLLDARKRIRGKALAVVEPDTTQDVAAVVRWCVDYRVPLVVQSGNTGLCGGSVPDSSGRALVLGTRRLHRVRGMDLINNTITVEAGVILHHVQQAAQEAQRLFPLSLASEGSCTIGGNLSTNAGGVHVLRYGTARELCLGLEVVTAQGQIWDGLRGLRKDNSGYDLRDLFIGSEGTLGIITAAVLKLYPRPVAHALAWVAVESIEQAQRLLGLVQQRLGARLSAFELIGDLALSLVLRHFASARQPLAHRAPWYVLLEVTGSTDQTECDEALQETLHAAAGETLLVDAVVSTSHAQARALWALRENLSEAQAREGKNIKHDIAVPISQVAAFVQQTDALLQAHFPAVRMVTFGHMGDGNLHYNVSPPEQGWGEGDAEESFLRRQEAINRVVHDSVMKFHGSISAEHGLGTLRRDEAARYKCGVEMDLMRAIKRALDPLGILNPGKVLHT